MIQCYHLSSSYRRCGTDQLITLPFLFCCLWLFVLFCVVAFVFGWFFVLFVCFVCVFYVGIVPAKGFLYWSYLSSTFEAHLREDG